jgi:uncharacterized protein (TIGR02466 family)
VSHSQLDRPFSEVELSFFEKQKDDTNRNIGNETTNDTYILHNPEMADLAKDMLESIDSYVKNVMMPVDGLTPYITQSWINYTKHGEHHHRHKHPNSIISGVFYINAEDGKDKIHFFDDERTGIQVNIKEFNVYNSLSWWLGVKTNDLLLFPSYLTHMVETTESDKTRVSLAFNVFMSGALGNQKELTELKI